MYQAPDLGSVINSRLLTTVNHLQSAFEEGRGFSKYHPSKNYWWDFGSTLKKEDRARIEEQKKKKKKKRKKADELEKKTKAEPSSMFQRRRVDMVLDLLVRKFPPKMTPPAASAPTDSGTAKEGAAAADVKSEKVETASMKSEKTEVSGTAGPLGTGTASSAGIKREAPSSASANQAKKSKLG